MALDFGDGSRGGHGLFDPIPNPEKKASINDDENDNSKEFLKDSDSDAGRKSDQDDDFEDWPTAPPLDILDCIKGYEMVSFDATSVPPPPFEEVEEEAGGKENEDKKEEGGEDGKQDGGEGGGEIKAKVRVHTDKGIDKPVSMRSQLVGVILADFQPAVNLTSIQYSPEILVTSWHPDLGG